MTQPEKPAEPEPIEDSDLESVVGGRAGFFDGKLLSAQDLSDEQSYQRGSGKQVGWLSRIRSFFSPWDP